MGGSWAGTAPPVVGGDEAPQGRWPSTAAIYFGGASTCTGVLIHERLALTAGHCDADTLSHIVLDRADLDSALGEELEVAERHAYPEAFSTFDVTLLVLAEPAETPPAELMLGCATAWLTEGARAQVVGYGNTEADGGGATSVLHEVEVPIVDPACEDAGADCNPAAMPDGELIAGGDGQDSCIGDSGGPLYLWSPEGPPVLAAITSRAALPATRTCGDGGIYVRVDAVADWIEQTSGLSLEEPACEGWDNTAPSLSVPAQTLEQDAWLEVELQPQDPDTWQALEVEVLSTEGVGAEVSGWTLRLHGEEVGSGWVALSVSDGLLSSTTELQVEVLPAASQRPVVVEAEPLHGCSSRAGGASWLLGLLGLLAYGSSQPSRRSSSATRAASAWCPETDRWQSSRNRSGAPLS